MIYKITLFCFFMIFYYLLIFEIYAKILIMVEDKTKKLKASLATLVYVVFIFFLVSPVFFFIYMVNEVNELLYGNAKNGFFALLVWGGVIFPAMFRFHKLYGKRLLT